MPNINNIKKYKKIHMIGIGGVSMSGIAEILVNWGFSVSGSDRTDSELLHILKNLNFEINVFNSSAILSIVQSDYRLIYTIVGSIDYFNKFYLDGGLIIS